MKHFKRFLISFLLALSAFGIFIFLLKADNPQVPILIIGQDVRSIDDYMAFISKAGLNNTPLDPKGFMVYTAINDPRGLSEPVDHGAGINHADAMIKKYPQFDIVQIGLYLKYMLALIPQGELDRHIDEISQWIKSSNKKVYLRIGYEFDNMDNEYEPTLYVEAYRYIVDFLRKRETNNVSFVWHSIAWRADHWPAYNLAQWYPGDDYVDIIGLSFFDTEQDAEREALMTFAQEKNKPVMIAESSPFNQHSVEQKKAWLDRFFAFIRSHDIHLISYINVNWDQLPLFKDEQWGDARLENNSQLIEEFLKNFSSLK